MWAVVFFLICFNIQFNLGTALNFLKEPSSKSTVKGNQITFDCQIDVSQPSYRWIKDESNITKGSVSVSGSVSTLLVDNLAFSDAGNYTCVAVDTRSGQKGERTGLLIVQGKPTIVQPPKVLVSYVGQSVIFHCVVVGNPKPNIRWKNSTDVITTRGRFEVFSNGSLKISNLLKNDDGSFFICEAKNSYGISTASATLYVNDPPTLPSFTVRPVSQTAQEGHRVTFYCTASGSPSPTVTWSKLAGSIPADRRHEPSPGSLRIVNLQAEDDGIYICTAQNFMGNVTAQVFLRIQGYPRITTGPSHRVVTENSSVQFRCVIEGDPVPYVRWTTPSGVTLTLLSQPSGSSSVLVNNSLSIAMVTVEDAGRYTCSAVNSIGQKSASAILTVLAPPRFSTSLSNRTQNVNSQLGVECEANAMPIPHYQWLFNSSVIARQKSLNLSSVSPADQGFYTCIANNSLGSAQGRFYLTIQAPPAFIASPKDQTIPKGQSATFSCSATGDPVPSIKWYKSNNLISGNAHFNILPNGTLTVKSVTEQDSGLYTCRATNEAGTMEAKASLLVADFPVFTSSPSDTSVEEGGTVTLPCRAHGPDVPAITWMKQDSSGNTADIVLGVDVQMDPGGDLKYTNVLSKNSGMHICKACNTAGCRTVKALLDVLFAPRFPVSPAPVYVQRGGTAVLECRPESRPPAVITWLRNGQSLSRTGIQYAVHNVQPADEGSYRCRAENSRGTANGDVNLSIGTKAEIKDFKQTLDPSQINKVLMQCIVGGSPSPEVAWHLQNSKLPNRQMYPDYDVDSSNGLRAPAAAVVSNSFLCNCSNPLNSVAKFARIPESPSKVTVTMIMETSLQVTWTQPDPLDLVLQYMTEVKSVEGAWEPVNDTIQGTSVIVNNLDSFTAYTFRVKAKNGLGTSNYSQPAKNATTLEGAPSVPRELELIAQNASVVFMSWVRPAVLNGYLHTLQYRINYTPQNGNTSKDFSTEHSSIGSRQNFTLQDLVPDTVYSVMVYAGRIRNDSVERWSESVSKTVTTRQLVPLTPPVDFTAQSNGPYQIMVKWKVPTYSIAGYDVWFKKDENTAAFQQVRLPSMSRTVYLILDLEPETKYEVKARMYSNAGIGPFSEPQIVKTNVDAFAVSSKLSSEEQSSGFQVAVICLLLGVVLLLVVISFACFKRKQSSRSHQSFYIENPPEDPSLKYVIQKQDRRGESGSRASTTDDSDGSFEGTYNFAVEDGEIDEGMFAGDRNSAHAQHPQLHYVDLAASTHDVPASSEFTEEEAIRLENFQPRVSPVAPRKNGTTFYTSVDVNQGVGKGSKLAIANVAESSSEDEDEPPDWVPPPPPHKKYQSPEFSLHDDRNDPRTSPGNLVKDATEESAKGHSASGPISIGNSSENKNVNSGVTVRTSELQLYAQVDRSRLKKNRTASTESPVNTKNELLTNVSPNDGDTSEDDSMICPPPPPPPQKLSNLPDDSDWERPLPPEIMALPGKRNRVASWANDESEDADKLDDFSKI